MQKTHGTGPLVGMTVIEMAAIGPSPFAAMLLADMGARVVRIDRIRGPTASFDIDPTQDVLSRNRESLALDLKRPEARDIVLELCTSASILIEGFRPGVMERLGLGPQACLERNPALVYGRMTGWGQQGPLAATAGHDLTSSRCPAAWRASAVLPNHPWRRSISWEITAAAACCS